MMKKEVIDIIDIREIILQIPLILEYYIPGLIFIRLFLFGISKKCTSNIIIYSIVASYFIKYILESVDKVWLSSLGMGVSHNLFISSAIAVILSYTCVRIYNNKIIKIIIGNVTHKSINNNIWQDRIDFDNCSMLHILDRSRKRYVGTFDYCEENGMDSWISIKDYVIIENGKRYHTEPMVNNNDKLLINMRDIFTVEIYDNVLIPSDEKEQSQQIDNSQKEQVLD